MLTFPNPLQVEFGTGRILVLKFRDADNSGGGVILRDTGEPHDVGQDANMPTVNEPPKPDEVYLHFANVESAKVLHEILGEVIAEWPADRVTT